MLNAQCRPRPRAANKARPIGSPASLFADGLSRAWGWQLVSRRPHITTSYGGSSLPPEIAVATMAVRRPMSPLSRAEADVVTGSRPFQPPTAASEPVRCTPSLGLLSAAEPCLTIAQSRQRHCRPSEVGRDRVQGQTRVRGPVHEHPAFQHRRIHRRRELRHPWPGADTVQQRALDRQGGRGRAQAGQGYGHEWMSDGNGEGFSFGMTGRRDDGEWVLEEEEIARQSVR